MTILAQNKKGLRRRIPVTTKVILKINLMLKMISVRMIMTTKVTKIVRKVTLRVRQTMKKVMRNLHLL